MNFSGKVPPRYLLLMLTALFIMASLGTAQARSRAWYIGIGYGLGSASGELNKDQVFFPSDNTTDGPFVFGVDLENGRGFVFNAGYAISKWIAFELLQTHLGMDAVSTNYPGETLDADFSSFILAARPMLPLGPFEIFGRVGFGGYGLDVQENTEGTFIAGRKDSTFSGGGYAWGGGVAFSLGRLGIEASYTQHEIGFDSLDGGGETGTISRQDLTVKTMMVILTINFGRNLK